MIAEHVLLDDGVVLVTDVRCTDARIGTSPEEQVPATEVNIPLSGVYVRTIRRPATPAAAREMIGDPGRGLVFRRAEPYRVRHPLGGPDRSLTIAYREPMPALEAAPDDRPIPAGMTAAARRLPRALGAGWLDPLGGAEIAVALTRAMLSEPRNVSAAPTARDARIVRAVRLEIAERLGARRTLPELGRRVGLSGWELARRFRRVTGTSVHAYRTGLRVQAALQRVDEGERDLTALALDLGFVDHSHLTNVVRQAVRRPPSAFRRPWSSAEGAALRTILQA